MIEKIIHKEIGKKAKILFGENVAFVHFNDEKNKNIPLFGKPNEKFTFITNILIKFNDPEYINSFIEENKQKKSSEIIKKFIGLTKKDFIKLEGNEGLAFKINLDVEIAKLFKITDKKFFKNRSMIKISGKLNQKKNIKKKLKLNKSFEEKTEEEKIIQLKTLNGDQNNDLENEESGQIENIENTIKEGEQEEKENNSGNEKIAEEFEKEEKLRNINIKLNSFEEKQIKALIRYYFFNKDLRENINKSNSNNKQFNAYDCYLINHIWMQNFKIFYLYDELVEIIEKILDEKNNQNNDEQIKMIFEKLPNEYILKINGKEKEYEQNIFELLEKTHFTFLKSKKNSSYPGDFEIINPEIYNLIQERQKIKLDLIKKSFIINSNKINIK